MPEYPPIRRFLHLPNRRVHYFRAGEGPPVVLLHSSPANARLLAGEIRYLRERFTVFAFDTAGFGLSQPLPLDEMEVADLADALADVLAAFGMPPCPMYGTHTGAAIALEFGVRHPERVTGLVLDGVPAFTADECRDFFADYFRKLPFDDLGSQYPATWTRFRDQSVWFPWSARIPANLNAYDLSAPQSTHLWVSMFFDAAETYAPAYRAACIYGDKAIAAARALQVPAVFTAVDSDMLYPHLERLPPLKPDQHIADIGHSYERKCDLIARSFADFGSNGAAPVDSSAIRSSRHVERQFVAGGQGNLHFRWCGDLTAPPIVVLHDAPGSSEQLAPLLVELGKSHFAIAPDLPGSGESDALAGSPDVAALADAVLRLLDTLALDQVSLLGVGIGSSVAMAIARLAPNRCASLALCGVLLPDPAERARLAEQFAPPIDIASDGSHWYRTWLMLRDAQIYWPWFDRTLPALRRVDADFSAGPLHRWTMDVMRARESYHHVIDAALADDAAAGLAGLARPPVLLQDRARPLSVYDERAVALRPDATVIRVDRLIDYTDALSATVFAAPVS